MIDLLVLFVFPHVLYSLVLFRNNIRLTCNHDTHPVCFTFPLKISTAKLRRKQSSIKQ